VTASGAVVNSIHNAAHRRLVELLKEAREKRGLTQVQVARKLRRPQSYVSSCESGQRRIDLIELNIFAKLYDVPLSRFLRIFGT
jgi:transcriptional regulator with XRE-family HTH domain